jgi:hypothetical protein
MSSHIWLTILLTLPSCRDELMSRPSRQHARDQQINRPTCMCGRRSSRPEGCKGGTLLRERGRLTDTQPTVGPGTRAERGYQGLALGAAHTVRYKQEWLNYARSQTR